MLKIKKFIKRFNFESKNLDKSILEKYGEQTISGVDFFSHLFQMWKANIQFQNKVVIIDSKILKLLLKDESEDKLFEFMKYLENNSSNLIVFTSSEDNYLVDQKIIDFNSKSLIFLQSNFKDEELNATLINYIYRKNAEVERVHGSLMSIFGEGVIIIGESGIGKSELVLNLLDRNHLFVADDALDIIEFAGELFGKPSKAIRNFLEIRGIGIIDIKKALGIETIVTTTKISLVIELKYLEDIKHTIDRLGSDFEKIKIHNQEIPKMTIPVSQGKNLASLIEMAIIVFKMKKYDKYDFLKEFNKNIKEEN